MKRFTISILLLLVSLLLPKSIIQAQITSLRGSGTTADPYLISSVAELKFMREQVNSGNSSYTLQYYQLTSSLNFSSEGDWIPIGTKTNYFRGIFDGNGKIIQNIQIGTENQKSTVIYAGLFGFCDYAKILNLGVEWKGIFISQSSGNVFCGGIVAYNADSNISNCYVTGTLSASSPLAFAGGVVGYNNNSVLVNCYASAIVTSSYVAGGVAGYIGDGSLTNCYSTGSVSATSDVDFVSVGGVAGYVEAATLANCYATGAIFSSTASEHNSFAGGIAGYISSSSALEYNLALNSSITAIQSSSSSKTFPNRIGYFYSGTSFKNSAMSNILVKKGVSVNNLTAVTDFSDFTQQGVNLTGSPLQLLNEVASMIYQIPNLIYSLPGTFLKSWKTNGENPNFPVLDTTDATPYTFFGTGTETDPYQIRSVNDLIVLSIRVSLGDNMYLKYFKLIYDLDLSVVREWLPIGCRYNDSFQGYFNGNGKIIKNLQIGTESQNANVGYAGLFGCQGGTVENLGVEVKGIYISTSGDVYTGGLAGYLGGWLNNCYASGKVVSTGIAGGLVGNVFSATIVNCYSTCTVLSYYDAGGLIGRVWSSSWLTNCYATGSVFSTLCAGGLVGEFLSDGIVANCYATGDVSSLYTAGGVVGFIGNGILTNCYASGAILSNNNVTSVGSFPDIAFAGGIAGHIDGTARLTYCLALNSSITAIRNSSSSNAYSYRIGYFSAGQLNDNYAASSIAVKKGTSSGNLTVVTDFSDTRQQGINFAGTPKEQLNEVASTIYKVAGTLLLRWKTNELNPYFPFFDTTPVTPYAFWGSGTVSDPYQIRTVGDLKVMSQMVSMGSEMGSKCFILTSDLDFSAEGDWIPIGTSTYPFNGTFNGNRKVINNIRIGTESQYVNTQYAGLFGNFNWGTIYNLCVKWNGIFALDKTNRTYIGGIAGYANGSVINCLTTGNFYSSTRNECHMGGIVGYLSYGMVANCYTSASVSSSSDISYTGGLVGKTDGGTVFNSYSSGTVFTSSYYHQFYSGGIIGYVNFSNAKVENCLALNDSITGIHFASLTSANVNRIGYFNYGTSVNNFAANNIAIKKGASSGNLTEITDFSDAKSNGVNLLKTPLEHLNSWVTTAKKINSIDLLGWEVIAGVNNGYPIFAGALVGSQDSKSKKEECKVYGAWGAIVVEGAKAGTPISIYTITGASIQNAVIKSNRTVIYLPAGLYLLNVGGRGHKVVLQ